nr:glycosyltransferase [uncultured Flavobacterium sp.]
MSEKLITIITVVYNSVDLIEDTIKSIIQFDSEDYEYIIVDGGSIDGTVEIIEKHLNNIDLFISETDNGIYDAMNKGIRVSSGEFIVFINCGDRLLTLPFKELSQNRDNSINCFPVYLSNMIKFYPEINWKLKIRNRLPHQGCYYKNSKELIYDLNYKVFSDFDLNQKYYKNKNKIKVFDEPIVAFHDMGGISNDKKYIKEVSEVIKNNFGVFYYVISLIVRFHKKANLFWG